MEPLYSGAQINHRGACCNCCSKLDQGWIAFLPFSPWGEQGEIQPGEIEQVRPPLTLFGRRHEALGQFQVFAIAGSQDQEIWSGRGHPFVGRLNGLSAVRCLRTRLPIEEVEDTWLRRLAARA